MKPHKRNYRLLQTLSGTVIYLDSGWSAEEWRPIEDAMSRYAGPSQPQPNPYPDTSVIREDEGSGQSDLFASAPFPVTRTH